MCGSQRGCGGLIAHSCLDLWGDQLRDAYCPVGSMVRVRDVGGKSVTREKATFVCLPLGALLHAHHLGVAGLGIAGGARALALPGAGHLAARLQSTGQQRAQQAHEGKLFTQHTRAQRQVYA